jgi:hypothetical protein
LKQEELKKKAKDAIGALFSDKSVSLETTLDSMEELASDIEANIMALKDDIERGRRPLCHRDN